MHSLIDQPFCDAPMDAAPRVLSAEQYEAIGTKNQRLVETLGPVMYEIFRSRKRLPILREMAPKFGLSASRFKHKYHAWLKHGEIALVNHNLCGGCGLPGCSERRTLKLHDETREEWLRLAARNDKRSLKIAHREIVLKLCHGERVPGVGTWRDIHMALHPDRPVPSRCPWSPHVPPPGWSLKNFHAKKISKAEYLLAKKGVGAAEAEFRKSLPVRSDTSALRPLEMITVDDHRLDFRIRVGTQICEVVGVFLYDIGFRKCLGFGLRPRLPGKDGVKESLTKRDVQHLLGDFLRNYGFPKKWPCLLLAENAAAAVTEECKALVTRATHGQMTVETGPVGHGRALADSYGERFGKPEWKRWLESYFNLLDIELGWVKGQMGSNYWEKPGESDARVSAGRRLAATGLMEQMPESVQPFHTLEEAYTLVKEAVHRTHVREGHDLEGFQEVALFRFDASEGEEGWRPLTDPAFVSLPMEQQNALLGDRRTGRVRKETPAEKWLRLHRPSDFQRISMESLFSFYLDIFPAKYQGHDTISVSVGAKRVLSFYGQAHKMSVGQEVVCRLDLDHPTHVWIQNKLGCGIGVMAARIAAPAGDRDAHAKQLGERMQQFTRMFSRVRATHADPAKIADLDRAIRILADAGYSAPDDEATTDASSADLLQEVSKTLAEDAGEDGADAYLALHNEG